MFFPKQLFPRITTNGGIVIFVVFVFIRTYVLITIVIVINSSSS